MLCPLCIRPVPLTAEHADGHSDTAVKTAAPTPGLAYALAQRIRLDDNLRAPEPRLAHTMGSSLSVNPARCDMERPPRASDPDRVRSLCWGAARSLGARHGRTVYEDLVLLDAAWRRAPADVRADVLPIVEQIVHQLRAVLGC